MIAQDIGGRLREARERRGWSLHDAAERTKLSTEVLKAIESNEFDRLPAGMYRKAYVRMLAAEVGLNPGEIAAQYSRLIDPPREPPPDRVQRLTVQEPLVRQLAPSPRRSLLSLAACCVLAAAWFMFQQRRVEPAIPFDALDGAIVPAVGPLKVGGAGIQGLRDTVEPALTIRPASDAPLRVTLAMTGPCWVAAEVDGERVIYRIVEGGERLALDAQQTISLRLGDAGSVTLSVNDGPDRSPGGPGQVVQLELTSDDVKALSAT
jgi:transcriptional regulator with XRE-family HTH domain